MEDVLVMSRVSDFNFFADAIVSTITYIGGHECRSSKAADSWAISGIEGGTAVGRTSL